ncbi:hypothetical protein HC028_18465 [Planosporangium flavigriseum]|uniref:Uncharacterized protein n=1 Tax=Planosporangium flavigriseum TaxID=373681 RepID=A0A8J3LRL4_9ACTN|nr:hypothetical protein [Planosporangium flavigriseum]NJC66472.1 hypothetical protein [Planosporangium flavigriseum]GIG76349.1 hypothetical protein Pfl04_47530 [Planosporangium flavigriseum]
MHEPTCLRVYVTGSAAEAALIAEAADELTAAGYLVTTATPTVGPDVYDLLDAVGDDLDAVAAADLLVTVGDCSTLFEPVIAELHGVPVVAVETVQAGAR